MRLTEGEVDDVGELEQLVVGHATIRQGTRSKRPDLSEALQRPTSLQRTERHRPTSMLGPFHALQSDEQLDWQLGWPCLVAGVRVCAGEHTRRVITPAPYAAVRPSRARRVARRLHFDDLVRLDALPVTARERRTLAAAFAAVGWVILDVGLAAVRGDSIAIGETRRADKRFRWR
jgi:hypothetical protein